MKNNHKDASNAGANDDNLNKHSKGGPGRAPEATKIGEHIVLRRRGKRGIWTADFHYFDQNGVRQHGRKSLRTRNTRAAEAKAWELDDQLAKRDHPGLPRQPSSATIEEGVKAFITSKKTDACSGKTIVKYAGELHNFAKYLKDNHNLVALSGLTIRHVDHYRAHRRDTDKLDPYTGYNHLIILKGWLKWCRRRGMIASNPLAEMESRQPRRRRHPAATMEQVNAILAKAQGWLFTVLLTLALTGMRVGEARALRPGDVDLGAGCIHIRRRGDWGPKTEDSERSIPIHRRLLALLKAKKKPAGEWFFNAPKSTRNPAGNLALNPRTVNEEFQSLAKQCGVAIGRKTQGLTLHSLRRFFKTFCMDAGVPKPMVDAWMGHRNQKDMDAFYYDSRKSSVWMNTVPFDEPSDNDLNRLNAANES